MQIFDAANISAAEFDQILSFLRAGGVIGFPTDTTYGLGADPFNEAAVRRIFQLKGRAETKPILVLVDSLEMLQQTTACSSEQSELIRGLARQYWPGPLTLILPALTTVPRLVTAGTGTIGVRWPRAPFATRMIHALGIPITATSANRSGEPSTSSASEVLAQLADLEVLVDGGILPASMNSTVLDLTQTLPTILREGPVSREALGETLGGHIR
jgi:L-threonylcarbamoyladenylate synthase